MIQVHLRVNRRCQPHLKVDLGVLVDDSVLDPLAPDLDELAGVGAVGGDELRHHRHLAAAVQRELGPGAPEGLKHILVRPGPS